MSGHSFTASPSNLFRPIEVNDSALRIVQGVSSRIGSEALMFTLPTLLFGEFSAVITLGVSA